MRTNKCVGVGLSPRSPKVNSTVLVFGSLWKILLPVIGLLRAHFAIVLSSSAVRSWHVR